METKSLKIMIVLVAWAFTFFLEGCALVIRDDGHHWRRHHHRHGSLQQSNHSVERLSASQVIVLPEH